MSEHMMSDWNAVRAQLEWPPHDRYSEAGLSDADLRYYLQRATQDIGALSEYGVTPDDSRLDRVNELLRRIELGAKITRPAARLSDFAEMMGGGLSEEEKLFVDKKISELESELESVVLGMSGHAGKQLGRRLTGLEVAEHNEAREKTDAAERKREIEITRLMIAKQLSRDQALAELERGPFAGINLERVRELGLKRVELKGSAAAQNLMARIFDRTRKDALDITIPKGQKQFMRLWNKACPHIAMPCMTQIYHGFNYLIALQNGDIIKNLDFKKRKISALPHFDRTASLFIMDVEDPVQYADEDMEVIYSKLLQELGVSKMGPVVVSDEKISAALWVGDPSDMKKTPEHEAVINDLGLDPCYYNFRHMEQDEYARLADKRDDKFWYSRQFTWLNNYIVIENSSIYSIGCSGELRVLPCPRDGKATARLVLECNK